MRASIGSAGGALRRDTPPTLCCWVRPLAGPRKTGPAADIVLLDAPDGGTQDNALDAIRHGDIAAIGAVVTAGVPRFVGRSRNTPATTRKARVAKSTVMQDFAAAAH